MTTQEFRANSRKMSVDGSADSDATFAALNVMSSVKCLMDVCHGAAANSGWWIDPVSGEDVRTWPKHLLQLWISTKMLLTVTELAEATEGLRKSKADEHLPHMSSFCVEHADALIRIMDLMGGLAKSMDFDFPAAVIEKLHYNARRADHKMDNRKAEGGKAF